MPLLPSPNKSYATREQLLQSVQAWAATQEYAIVIARSDNNKVILGCDRGCQYHNRKNLNTETRRRNTGIRLVQCFFQATASQKYGEWYLVVCFAAHNHEPSTTITQHLTLC